MAKKKTVFLCEACGDDFPRWQGKCPSCGQWNSLVEQTVRSGGGGGAKRTAASRAAPVVQPPRPVTDIEPDDGRRVTTGIEEFDRILGGGLVEGAAALLGGEPGVGKSTLMLQVSCMIARRLGAPVLYVTGEESARQTRMRAERLDAFDKNLLVQCETDLDAILGAIENVNPAVTVIDSIQTVGSADIGSAPGSVAQIRDCAARLVRPAKTRDMGLFFIGHVTKEGVVAGPRLLEHMVDVVLYFEGERHFSYRILRSVKNRFGSTNEIGVFEMSETGLRSVPNPSEMFLSERPENTAGSVVLAAVEGTRPLLVEVQALVSPNGGFGTPRRSAHGLDVRRLALILAVLEKRLGLTLSNQDVFVNIAGGLAIDETALDLAVAAAVVSSALNRPVDRKAVVFGEIGLAGETRSVGQVAKRLNEARRLGFGLCVYGAPEREKPREENALRLYPASSVEEALRLLGLAPRAERGEE